MKKAQLLFVISLSLLTETLIIPVFTDKSQNLSTVHKTSTGLALIV